VQAVKGVSTNYHQLPAKFRFTAREFILQYNTTTLSRPRSLRSLMYAICMHLWSVGGKGDRQTQPANEEGQGRDRLPEEWRHHSDM